MLERDRFDFTVADALQAARRAGRRAEHATLRFPLGKALRAALIAAAVLAALCGVAGSLIILLASGHPNAAGKIVLGVLLTTGVWPVRLLLAGKGRFILIALATVVSLGLGIIGIIVTAPDYPRSVQAPSATEQEAPCEVRAPPQSAETRGGPEVLSWENPVDVGTARVLRGAIVIPEPGETRCEAYHKLRDSLLRTQTPSKNLERSSGSPPHPPKRVVAPREFDRLLDQLTATKSAR